MVLNDRGPLLIFLNEVREFGFGGTATFGAIGHELDSGCLADRTHTDADLVGNKPTAFLALAVLVFGVDGEDAVLAKPVATDDGDFFDVASVAEEFAAVGVVGIGEVYEDCAVVGVGRSVVEGGLPKESGGAAGEFGGNALGLADGDRGGMVLGEGLDDEVGFAGFIGGGVEVMDFSGRKPGSFAFEEEVVHGAGRLEHGYCGFNF